MMKNTSLISVLLLASSASAQTVDFSGFYQGLQVGSNQSEATGLQTLSTSSTYPGLVAGYSMVSKGNLLGLEGFANAHHKSTTGKDAGLGLKVGRVFGPVLVYGRVAATGSWPSVRPQVGLGAEYKWDKHWALTVFTSRDQSSDAGIDRKNTNVALGLNYYFSLSR